MCLAVSAVGVVQVFGVQVGYLCGCTGQTTSLISCLEEVCHSNATPEINQASHQSAEVEQHGAESGSTERFPCENQHKHSEIRENLVVTTLRSLPAVPLVVLFDLPMAFQLPEIAMKVPEMVSGSVLSDPPEYGSPPMPLLVARTMVMMI